MSNSAKPHNHFTDVEAASPWSTWGNCNLCGDAAGKRFRVRTCNYPGTESGGGQAITVSCPTTGANPYVLVDGVLTQTDTDPTACFTGGNPRVDLAPYSDTCDLGKFNF